MATAEFSKFADILSAALSQHHLLGFEIAQLGFHQLLFKKKKEAKAWAGREELARRMGDALRRYPDGTFFARCVLEGPALIWAHSLGGKASHDGWPACQPAQSAHL